VDLRPARRELDGEAVIFVTTSIYALAKELGPDEAVREFHTQLKLASSPPFLPIMRDLLRPAAVQQFMPAVRTIARLQTIDGIGVRVDGGATCIGKGRSRAFHAFLEADADTWVSVDDDNEATLETLEWLIEAVRGTAPRICIAPYWLRRTTTQQPILAVELPRVAVFRELSGGGRVRNASSGGFGLVAVNRAAADAIVTHCTLSRPDLRWQDDDDKSKWAVFHDALAGGKWWGEDLSFFRRLPKEITVEALCTGHTSHAGDVADLRVLV
jgi:hypothetical protein